MPTHHFDVLLRQPVIISQHSATMGGHECLDYLPGSVFLGLAASRLYQVLPQEDSWRLFHSGHVRFSDALPLVNGEIAWPTPLNWHYHKGESPRDGDRLKEHLLYDPSNLADDALRQPVQLRGGYVTESGGAVMPARNLHMKTALDRNTGLAADGQLFGYQALEPGLNYRFTIESDAEVPAELISRLMDTLPGKARIGRSRSAEFGAISIVPASCATTVKVSDSEDPLVLTLWLLSDLQLLHRGQPALQPLPELIDLPRGSQWLSESSFMRGRRYSPWNSWRRHNDAERQVISRGSILRYRLPDPLDAEDHGRLAAGLGLHIESGLGRVWVNPPLLADNRPRFSSMTQTVAAGAVTPSSAAPSSALILRLRERAAQNTDVQIWQRHAEELFQGLIDRVSEARAWQAVPANQPILNVPGRSQWGRLKTLATDFRGKGTELLEKLTHEEQGILRERSGWELRFGPGTESNLGRWLSSELHSLHSLESLESQGNSLDRILGHLAELGLQPRWTKVCEGRSEVEP